MMDLTILIIGMIGGAVLDHLFATKVEAALTRIEAAVKGKI